MRRHPGEWALVAAGIAGVVALASVPVLLGFAVIRGVLDSGLGSLVPAGTYLVGTLGLGLGVAALCLPLGLAAAVWLELEVRASLRPRLQAVVLSLEGLPSVVVGFVAVTLIRPLAHLPDVALLVVLLVAMALPHAIGRSLVALRAVPALQLDAARALGAGRTDILLRLVLPAAGAGLVGAALVAGLRALGDTVVVFLLVGAEGSLRTLTTGVVAHAGAPTAASMALVLALAAAAITLVAQRLGRGGV